MNERSAATGLNGRQQTVADRRAYLEGGLEDLVCDDCGVYVRVKKTSPQHTSVQWSTLAVRGCPELAARAAGGQPTALVATCAKLRDSIERAAREGRLDISATEPA
jgi:hypothetical protein